MIKISKSDSNFIIKLAKQVDSNSKDIEKILKIISAPIQKTKNLRNNFNVRANFNHPTTLTDKQFLTKFANEITQVLITKGVKDFQMTFKK